MRTPIRTKLTLAFLVIALVALSVSGVLFYAFVKKAITAQAFQNLNNEAQTLMETFESDLDTIDQAQPGQQGGRQLKLWLKLATRTTSAGILLIDLDDKQRIVASNLEHMARGQQFPINVGKLTDQSAPFETVKSVNKQDFLIYATRIPGYNSNAVVLLAPTEIVGNVMKDMILTLLKGFLITLVVVILVGFVLSRSLTRPVQQLGKQMSRLAKRDFSPPEVVKTGDEIEEVSRAFASMVEALNRYNDGQRRFLQNASHELKTPLMAIQGYAEGIKDGIFADEEADTGLDVIIKESTRLKKLVDELIYLSKLETLEDIYLPSEENFTDIVHETLNRLHSLALQKDIELVMTGDGIYPVYVDPDKMMQVLINLVSNGIRHARTRVEVELRREGNELHAVIRDDGEGFTGPQEQIFERFYKGDKGDTGLGLAIVKAIVEKSHGKIDAQNAEHGGAVFHLRLPLRTKKAPSQ